MVMAMEGIWSVYIYPVGNSASQGRREAPLIRIGKEQETEHSKPTGRVEPRGWMKSQAGIVRLSLPAFWILVPGF